MNTQLLIIAGLCGLFIWKAALWVRPHAEQSPALRKGILVGAVPAMIAGVLVALWLPEQIPFNRESPAGLIYVYFPCWLVGSLLFFGGMGGFIGAWQAHPKIE